MATPKEHAHPREKDFMGRVPSAALSDTQPGNVHVLFRKSTIRNRDWTSSSRELTWAETVVRRPTSSRGLNQLTLFMGIVPTWEVLGSLRDQTPWSHGMTRVP